VWYDGSVADTQQRRLPRRRARQGSGRRDDRGGADRSARHRARRAAAPVGAQHRPGRRGATPGGRPVILALTIGVLTTGAVYLMLERGMVRIIFGLALLSHAANLTLLAAGVPGWRAEPLGGTVDPELAADPLPQAFVLTAIVITLAVTV